MSNTALWDAVCKTDPKEVKAITGKDYSGNSPKPYYIVRRLTEMFGPCGIGWGYSIESERFERFSDTDVLHIAKIRLWYIQGERRGEVEQMGQTKASYFTSSGKLKVDEDAPKKSVTDALVKCASYLGFAGDIFSGRWDDSKYVAELRKEFDKPKGPSAPITPLNGAGVGIPQDRRDELDELALYLIDCHQNEKDTDAIKLWYADETWSDERDANEERKYVWLRLAGPNYSKLRSTIKASNPHKEAA